MELQNGKDKRKRKTAFDLGNYVHGKVPPQSRELEEAVLGAILIEKGAMDIAVEILRPECFYVDANQRIFAAMLGLEKKSMPIDLLTVVEELKNREELDAVGGPYYVTKLTNSVVSSANIEAHCRIVLQKHMARRLIQIGGEMVDMGYDDSSDIFDAIDASEKLISGVNENIKTTYTKVDAGVVKVLQKIDALRNSTKELTGIDTGFIDINKLTCGWQEPDLIILAARPSVGKTALALNFARNACKKGVPVGFFSLEMSEAQLIYRLLSIESQMPLADIIRGKLTEDRMKDLYKLGAQPISDLPLYIDDTSAINIHELRSKARKMYKAGCRLIIIDYLQLMSGIQNARSDNREQEISKISRDLKSLAKELMIPIIALSQLSRAVESRTGEKMPILSDLRESGAIEQDADIVMFMYRPEYYGKNANEHGEALNGETHLKFAKHRSGALDTIRLQANLSIQKFNDTGAIFPPQGTVNIEKGARMVDQWPGTKKNLNPDLEEDAPF